MHLHRRGLIASSAALAFSGLARSVQAAEETYLNEVEGYGPLKRDPNGLLDLPDGFSYRIVSQGGETMADGLLVPGQFDGMGCFGLGGTRVALVRNHELKGSSAAHRNWGPGAIISSGSACWMRHAPMTPTRTAAPSPAARPR